ncbi:MAG: dipeptidase [Chloroflexi bacterium]|nr:dipeptidase [Chloroflexota bacterium]
MEDVFDYLTRHRERAVTELVDLLRIPSVSALPAHREDVRRAAHWLVDHLTAAGLEHAEILPTAGHPVVYADWLHAPGKPTVLIYNHYDVQPVDPLDEWERPPFEPIVRDGQVYGRGAADDKGQLLMHVKAIEAWLVTRGALPVNLKILYEGEEEVGSEHLEPFLEGNRERLRADVVVISDTSMFDRGVPAICYGLRGLAYFELHVQGPGVDLHSGSYGGAIGNPAEMLARIIARLKDDDGRILVPGFYDDVRPLSDRERETLAQLPFDDGRLSREVGVPALHGEPGWTTLERLWIRPTLDVCGLWGGFQGDGPKTIIPARASAKLSCRLVPDQRPERVLELIERYLPSITPPSVTCRLVPMHGGLPSITPIDHPAVRAAMRALETGFGVRPVFIRQGGSIPVVASFEQILGLPTVLMGVGLPDEHFHAPNERFDLENYYRGARAAAALWQEMSSLAACP